MSSLLRKISTKQDERRAKPSEPEPEAAEDEEVVMTVNCAQCSKALDAGDEPLVDTTLNKRGDSGPLLFCSRLCIQVHRSRQRRGGSHGHHCVEEEEEDDEMEARATSRGREHQRERREKSAAQLMSVEATGSVSISRRPLRRQLKTQSSMRRVEEARSTGRYIEPEQSTFSLVGDLGRQKQRAMRM